MAETTTVTEIDDIIEETSAYEVMLHQSVIY